MQNKSYTGIYRFLQHTPYLLKFGAEPKKEEWNGTPNAMSMFSGQMPTQGELTSLSLILLTNSSKKILVFALRMKHAYWKIWSLNFREVKDIRWSSQKLNYN